MSMRMKTTLLSLLACFCLVLGVAPTVAQTPKAKRINRAIDSLSRTTACAIWRPTSPYLSRVLFLMAQLVLILQIGDGFVQLVS